MREKREYLMQAHDYEFKRVPSGHWFWSRKLDGFRLFWDGGITRGMPASQVPWANTEKDYRLKDEVISTGLWTRYGKVFRAPDFWIDRLPTEVQLDGELYLGRGQWQALSKIVKAFHANELWEPVQYLVFEKPTLAAFTCDGRVENGTMKKIFKEVYNHPLVAERIKRQVPAMFESNNIWLQRQTFWNDTVQLHEQIKMPMRDVDIDRKAMELSAQEVELGGEGGVLRNGSSVWFPHRSYGLLKIKPYKDAEGTVVGYVSGVEGKEGRRLGKIGSIIIAWNGILFNLSGLTNQEIDIIPIEVFQWAMNNPDTKFPDSYSHHLFPLGSKITFKYRELTDDGKPKEARYWRKHEEM